MGKGRCAQNVIGNKYGDLIVVDEYEPHVTPNGSKQRVVKCKCVCGNEFVTRLTQAKNNKKCFDCMCKERRKDISGKRFGKLVVISMSGDYFSPSGRRLSRCLCQCDCGNTCIVNMSSLITGATQSCGCMKNKAGLLKDNLDLMKKYDFERNADLDLKTLTARTSKKIWWKCNDCGNSWYATVASQNDEFKHGCPYCSGRLPIKGKTDLASKRPELLCEWDYSKNKCLPDEVSPSSSKKMWWKCKECGYSWKAVVSNRTKGSGCPKCNLENVSSFCEQAVFYYVKQLFPDAINGDKEMIGMELDIVIPSINKAIEYDGEAWHNSKRKFEIDNQKNFLCSERNIELIRIREPRIPKIDNCIVFVRTDSTSESSLNKVIIDILNYISPHNNICVDVIKDTPLIVAQYASKRHENSLSSVYPNLVAEWHPTKNGELTPDHVSKGSSKKIWWICEYGHEWQMSISDRGLRQQGCPYCSGKRVLAGFNDLQSKFPQIAKEWHPTKNGGLMPDQVSKGSSKKIWWICEYGHEWQDTPNHRCLRNSGCPVCFSIRRSPKVICEETGQVFSGKEAACFANLKSPSLIYECCRNKVKKAGGYHWKFDK